MIPISDFANDMPPMAFVGDANGMLVEENLDTPISMYLARVQEILTYGSAERLTESSLLGRLLVLGIVSAAEAYFRAVMAASMEICPLARSNAAEKTINLGGLLWHGQQGFSRSAFDNMSFASGDELKKTSQAYLGFALEPRLFESPLEEYDKICQLRHGIVHADGILPGRNAVKLNIPRFGRPVRIVISYRHLQDAAAVMTTLVTLYNRGLFDLMCRRWAIDWRRRSDWDVTAEQRLFQTIWNTFVSKDNLARRQGRSRMRKIDCMGAVKSLFNI